VLEAQERCEKEAASQGGRLLPRQHQRENQNSIEEAIVLEMDMIDDQKARREEDRESRGLGREFLTRRGGLHETSRR
jgi:hypothetical protein